MITFLSKFFIKEKEDKGKIRQEYGILCGMVGIFLNILLFCGKFFAGTISHSIAVTADAQPVRCRIFRCYADRI